MGYVPLRPLVWMLALAMPPDLIVVDVDGEPAGAAVDRMVGGQPELVDVPAIVITDEAPVRR